MPRVGTDLILEANLRGDDKSAIGGTGKTLKEKHGPFLQEVIRDVLYGGGDTRINMTVRRVPGGDTRREPFHLVSGHLWGYDPDGPSAGPMPANIMVIGKNIGDEELSHRRLQRGPSGRFLLEALHKLGASPGDWYVTNVLKTVHLDGDRGALKAYWIENQRHLLHQEFRLVRPKFVLLLGADAVKSVLGKDMSLGKMEGRVVELTIPITKTETHTMLVMACLHPAAVQSTVELTDKFYRSLSRFLQLTRGQRWDQEEPDLDHRVVRTEPELLALLEEANAQCSQEGFGKLIGLDAEWHGEHPQNRNAYLRTVQISWAYKKAAVIVVHEAGGKEVGFSAWARDAAGRCLFDESGQPVLTKQDSLARLYAILREFFADKRLVGHQLCADAEVLLAAGVDLRSAMQVPDDWRRCKWEGPLDTSLMAHAVDETDDFTLTGQTLRRTDAPRYDLTLQKWKERYCSQNGLKPSQLDGYGDCPDEILYPYACLHRDSLVQLADGSWRKIGELVRTRYAGCVKAFKDGRVVDARVTNWHARQVNQKEWFKLRTATTPRGRHGIIGPILTPDHKVLTQRGKVEVCQLRPGEDAILTEEVQFSEEQLSVFLGSLLGDGGFTRQNDKKVGFGFGQRSDRAEYVDWKAATLANHRPAMRSRDNQRRYELPYSRYLAYLSRVFPTHPVEKHRHRKAKITPQLLENLGLLGLAVWYQDDGSLVSDRRSACRSSRIACCKLSPEEQELVLSWLRPQFGDDVTYNRKGGFIQIAGSSFRRFHLAIRPFIHPVMSYKSPFQVDSELRCKQGTTPFYEPIEEVVAWSRRSGRGHGVRYCLTVAEAGNFLTQAGFVSNCYDADVTRRVCLQLIPQLDRDVFGNNCWKAYWLSAIALRPVLEIDTTGLLLDRQRVDDLVMVYMEARSRLASQILTWARWPTLKLSSRFHVAELLFGERYNGHGKQPDGQYRRLRPEGARIVGTLPVLTTDKRPKPWDEVMQAGKEDEYTAATNKQVLGMLLHDSKHLRVQRDGKWVEEDCSEIIGAIRDYRFISQVLKSVLREPLRDEEDEEAFVVDDDDMYQYGAGVPGAMCDDYRVRTFISQLKETGRWASARPPLQNFSNRREADYKRILGKQYRWPLRSIFCADTDYVIVEADYTGAELYGMAIMSGDDRMIRDAQRNLLPEDHADYYDIHSNIAKLAFGLDCEPTKAGLKRVGKKHLRIVAKSVIFGVAYGRGAKAIAIAAREEGVEITEAEAQSVIDAIFQTYPRLATFFEACRRRAVSDREARNLAPRWLCGPFGRYRRFPEATDFKTAGDLERQAQNFPIQGLIADAVSIAVANLYRYREEHPELDFRFLLQIHDSIILLVHKSCVARVCDEVIPRCMEQQVTIRRHFLDGVLDPASPEYHLGVDVKASTHWGVTMLPDECWQMGFDPEYAGWRPHAKLADCWVNPEDMGDSVWCKRDGRLYSSEEELLAAAA